MLNFRINQNQIDFYGTNETSYDLPDIVGTAFFENTGKGQDFKVTGWTKQKAGNYKVGDREYKRTVNRFGQAVVITACVVSIVAGIAIVVTAIASAPVSAPIAACGGALIGYCLRTLLYPPSLWSHIAEGVLISRDNDVRLKEY